MIDSSNDVVLNDSTKDETSVSAKDEMSISCRVRADADSATAGTSFLDLRRGKRLSEYRDLMRSIYKMTIGQCACKLGSEIYL
jgi:hypothetical protein